MLIGERTIQDVLLNCIPELNKLIDVTGVITLFEFLQFSFRISTSCVLDRKSARRWRRGGCKHLRNFLLVNFVAKGLLSENTLPLTGIEVLNNKKYSKKPRDFHSAGDGLYVSGNSATCKGVSVTVEKCSCYPKKLTARNLLRDQKRAVKRHSNLWLPSVPCLSPLCNTPFLIVYSRPNESRTMTEISSSAIAQQAELVSANVVLNTFPRTNSRSSTFSSDITIADVSSLKRQWDAR